MAARILKIGLQTWGSEGDIRPFTALAAALARAGHRVTLVLTDNLGRDYSDVAQRHGFALVNVPLPQTHDARQAEAIWRELVLVANPVRQVQMILQYGMDPVVDAMYEAARALCADSDVVVGHFFVHPLRVAAEKAGIPLVTVNVVHNCQPSALLRPPGMPELGRWSYSLGWALVRRVVNAIFLPRVNALRRREGLRPQRDVMTEAWVAPQLNLIAVSPQFCTPPPDWDARHRVCGFLDPPLGATSEALPEGMEEFLDSGAAPVYLSFGSMMLDSPDYIRDTVSIWIRAVREVGCRAILQYPASATDLPATGRQVLAVRRAPYARVFPRCAAIVHHGGAGTTQSSLLAGRPSVVVAHIADQIFWGQELQRLGAAGPALTRRRLTAPRLARALRLVLASPEMARRASALGHAMAQEDGAGNAVRYIEEMMRRGSSVPTSGTG